MVFAYKVPEKDGNVIKIKLESQNASNSGKSLNEKIVNFCYLEIDKWSTEEWRRISDEYVDGGLNKIKDFTYKTLNVIPSRNLDKSLFQSPQKVDLQRGLHSTFVEFSNDISFNQQASGEELIGLIGRSAFLFMGARYDTIAIDLLTFITRKATQSSEYQSKLRKAKTELINNLSDYYENIAKDLVSQLMQNINRALKVEKQRLDDSIDEVEEEYKNYAATVKKRLEKQKARQQELERDKAELERIHRL